MPEESRTLKFNLAELTEAVYDFARRTGTISAGERILPVEIRGAPGAFVTLTLGLRTGGTRPLRLGEPQTAAALIAFCHRKKIPPLPRYAEKTLSAGQRDVTLTIRLGGDVGAETAEAHSA